MKLCAVRRAIIHAGGPAGAGLGRSGRDRAVQYWAGSLCPVPRGQTVRVERRLYLHHAVTSSTALSQRHRRTHPDRDKAGTTASSSAV